MKLASLFKTLAPSASEQKKDRVVGIDIGSSSIKVVELQSREGVVTLTTYGELQLGPYGEKEIGEIFPLTPDLEKQALVDILRESATKATSGVFAIPLSVSFVTVVSLEAAEEEDIDPRIRVEARKYIPVPLAEVTLDWAEIEKSESDVARNILLAAIQNKPLQRFNTLLSGIGMPGTPTEIECFSAIRGAGVATKDTAAVIDFGATSAKLYITRKGLLQRMYRIPVGSVDVTNKLKTELNMSFADAEILKKTVSTNDEEFASVQKTYGNHFNRALTEFSHVLKEYRDASGMSFDAIVLTGSGVLFPNFTKQVSEVLDQPVTVANPFDMVAYPAFMEDTLKEIGPTFTTALGSALRSFI
ncbi:MAG: pilus assembly protein PilM [Candidatus Paceibacteria bacterium]